MASKLQNRWQWSVWILLALLLNGCAMPVYTGPIFQGQSPSPAAPLPDQTAQSSPAGLGTNRLLLIGTDGNLYTADPDGQRSLALTQDASPTRLYSQPTWSSTGERIAWTRIDDSRGHLVIARPDGGVESDTELPFPPFYYAWNSGGDRLAYLSNWTVQDAPTLALRLLDMTGPQPILSTIATGQPLYFSWAPTGDFLLTHIGNAEVGISSLQGRSTLLSRRSGNFAAPQWLADPTLLAYTVIDGGEQQMVVGNLRSGQVQNLANFRGVLGFSISPDGHRLAYTDSGGGQGMNSFGPLVVLDVRSAEFRQLSSQPVIAFFWSPDGASLLYMAAEVEAGVNALRLAVWDGQATTDLGRYRPSATFLSQYLRFADQYGQSAAYWSPDSRAVLFAGRNESGENGIWVIPADGSPAQRVARGVYAAWSRR